MMKTFGKGTLLTVSLLLVAGLSSCSIDKKLEKEEQELIRSYIATNNITVEPTATGLYYIESLSGGGNMPVDGDTVLVSYKTMFLSGYVIDASPAGQPYKFKLGINWAIPGFEEGIKLMKLNGKSKLVVPSSLAYGPMGYGIIGGYTPLLFEVELKSIIPGN
jgi:FKBP-type peptidyl-prolyl cis-trans isomerase FkpA